MHISFPRSIIYICFFFLASWSPLTGQTDVFVYKNAPPKIQTTYRKARESGRNFEYNKSLKIYEKLMASQPGFVDPYLQAGSIWYERKEYAKAETYFEKALDLDPEYRTSAWVTLALSEKAQKKFDEAATHFAKYLELEKDNKTMRRRAEILERNSRFIAEAIGNPVPFDPQPLGKTVNTDMAEYLPILTADGKTLLFTRVVKGQEDFYTSEWVDSAWTRARPVKELNTVLNEGGQTISPDGQELVFTACDRKGGIGSCDLFITTKIDGKWAEPQSLGRPVNTVSWESQPCFSPDGSQLFFSSSRDGGYGGRDLWVTYRDKTGKWGTPINLGPEINTGSDEETPFLHADGQTLYFMSEGHPGMGAADVFMATRVGKDSFTEPQNLGFPINTENHEGTFFVSLDGTKAFFASDRIFDGNIELSDKKRRNHTDIYQFDLAPSIRPKPTTYVKAVVKDIKTKQPLGASAVLYRLSDQMEVAAVETRKDGSFLLCLPAGSSYGVQIEKEGYLFHSEHFALETDANIEQVYSMEILLQPIEEKQEDKRQVVILRNVFFESGSAALNPSSFLELNKLAKLLESHPDMEIRINGHTDNVGSVEDNQALSEERAKAVVKYLLSRGISNSRMRYQGFGEEIPIDDNDSESGRANNRRTEFEIL